MVSFLFGVVLLLSLSYQKAVGLSRKKVVLFLGAFLLVNNLLYLNYLIIVRKEGYLLALSMLFKETSQPLVAFRMPHPSRVYVAGGRTFYKLRDIALENDIPSYKLRYMCMEGQLDGIFTLYQDEETRRYYVYFGQPNDGEWPIRPFVYALEKGGSYETR